MPRTYDNDERDERRVISLRLAMRCKRYAMLVEKNAPQILLENEERLISNAFAQWLDSLTKRTGYPELDGLNDAFVWSEEKGDKA